MKLKRILAVAGLFTLIGSGCSSGYKFGPEDQAEALNSVAVGYAQVGQNDKASKLLAQALKSAKLINNPNIGKPYYLTNVAVGYAQVGQYDQAFSVAKLIHSWERFLALNKVSVKAAEAGHYDQAIELAKRMTMPQPDLVAQAQEYTPSLAAEALAKVALNAVQAKQYNQAFQAIKAMADDKEHKALVLAKIADKATQTEPAPQALQILAQSLQVAQAIKYNDAKASALASIAVSYAQLRQKPQASKLLAQALQVAQTIKDKDSKENTLSEIAIRYAVAGQKADAPQMLAEALHLAKTLDASTLIKIAVEMANAGQKEKAQQIITQVFPLFKADQSFCGYYWFHGVYVAYGKLGQYDQALRLIKPCIRTEKAKPLTQLADMAALAGQYDKALEIAKSLEDFSSPISEEEEEETEIKTEVAVSQVAVRAAQAGQYGQALMIIKSLKQTNGGISYGSTDDDDNPFKDFPDNKESAVRKIALHAAHAGQYDQALMFVNLLEGKDKQVETLTELAVMAIQAGHKDKALQLLDQALEITKSFFNGDNADVYKVRALTEIAPPYAKLGQKDKAMRILDQAQEIAQTLGHRRVNLGQVRLTF